MPHFWAMNYIHITKCTKMLHNKRRNIHNTTENVLPIISNHSTEYIHDLWDPVQEKLKISI